MKAVLLCRVSSKEQEETGYSLPAQEKLLSSYAESKGFSLAKIFSITESASGKKQREIFDGMMAHIKHEGIKIIICEKVDRLTRNFKDAVDIDEWLEKDEERQVHLVKDSLVLHKNSRSQEKLNWGIRILFAKNYIDNLSEEVKKGQKEKLAQGWLPMRAPLGYMTIGEKGHKTFIIDPNKAPLVKRMFELYSKGDYSTRRLADTMYKLGLRNNNGGTVYKSRIHELLTDPFYIGKIRWNNQIYEGRQEALIEQETFDKIQQILKGKTTPKYSKHSYLFQSLVKCAECDGLITWEIHKGHVYGHCNHYRDCSQQTWVTDKEVEEQIVEAFDHLQIKNSRLTDWIRRAIKDSHKNESEFHASSINELNQRLTTIEKRFEKIYDDKIDENITEEFYQKKFQQYTQEKEQIEETLKKHSQSHTSYYELATNIFDLSQRAKEIYTKAKDIEQKRQLIKLVFYKITLNEGIVSYEYSQAFKLLSEAVKLTNSSKVTKNITNTDKIFEPQEKIDVTKQTDNFVPTCPIWLPE